MTILLWQSNSPFLSTNARYSQLTNTNIMEIIFKVGNIVSFDNKVYTIHEICSGGGTTQVSLRKTTSPDEDINIWPYSSELKPVMITNQILEKLGFIRCINDKYIEYTHPKHQKICIAKYAKFDFYSVCKRDRIIYLHEMQDYLLNTYKIGLAVDTISPEPTPPSCHSKTSG